MMRAGWRAGVAGVCGVLTLVLAPLPALAGADPHPGRVPPGQVKKAARFAPTVAFSPTHAPAAAPSAAPASALRRVVAVQPAPAQPEPAVEPLPVEPLPAPIIEPAPLPAAQASPVVRVVVVAAQPRWLPAFLLTLLGGLMLLALVVVRSRRRSAAARARFLDAAAHDLRTPISVIHGYVGMAQEGILGDVPPALADALPVLDARATELEEAIEKLLGDA